jgi:hypothetical protein
MDYKLCQDWLNKFNEYGITIKELIPIKVANKTRFDAILRYDFFGYEFKAYRLDKFYHLLKQSKTNTNILKDCKRYKDTYYVVHKDGSVYSLKGIVKKLKLTNKNGYKLVDRIPVHQVVLEAWGFPQPTPNHIVRHLNDIPDDNRLENLQWGFQLVNMKDKEVNADKRKELIKSLFKANLFSLEEISILTKIKLESIEGILKTF